MPGPNAFGPDRKLPDKPAFDRVFSEPDFRLRRHPFLLLARRRESGPSRLGLVVGKKHARRAVARNRIRRAAREQFRLILASRSVSDLASPAEMRDGAVDVILMARPGAAEFDKTQLAEIIAWLFERLRRETSPPGSDDSRPGAQRAAEEGAA